MPVLVLATRSSHKLREIRDILGDCGADLVSLSDRAIEPRAEEDDIECFDSFAANAIAKARYFCVRTALPTVADDSGIVVPALGGAPGVLSRRFAETLGVTPAEPERDAVNTRLLLERARPLHGDQRRAYYACAAALALPAADDGREPALHVFAGTCEGVLADAPRGDHGFGYDPVFLLPGLGLTFAEVEPALKQRLSHRARAFRALAAALPVFLRT